MALSLLIPVGIVHAQLPDGQTYKPGDVNAVKKEQRQFEEFKKAHPDLFKFRDPGVIRKPDFADAKFDVLHYAHKMAQKTAPLFAYSKNVTIWAQVTNLAENNADINSVTVSDPVVFTNISQKQFPQAYFRGTVQYDKDNHALYGLYFVNGMMPYYYLSKYDTETWEGETSLHFADDMSLSAYESAQAKDGTVYTVGWNANADGRELATIDLRSGTPVRTVLGTIQNYYVALGITNANVLYGVASDGYLYKIGMDGTETAIGPTGLTVATSDGAVYTQTGEIDQSDNTFYWLAVDADRNNALYEIDLNTGQANYVGATNDTFAQGMVILGPNAEPGAPAMVTDGKVLFGNIPNYSASEHTGTLDFTAPTTTFDGNNQLTGQLTYVLYDESQSSDSIAGGVITPGEHVSESLTFEQEGLHKLHLTVRNSVGESPACNIDVLIGYDTPKPITNLRVEKDTLNPNNVNITWTATDSLGLNGFPIDKPGLTYDVYRTAGNDTVAIASGLTSTSYVDHTAGSAAYYHYGVQARTKSGKNSATVWTKDGLVVGDDFDENWSTTFKGNDQYLFDIWDINNDGHTWLFDELGARSNYARDNGNDDWLVTPAIKVKKGHVYTFAYRAWNRSPNWTNKMEVKWGDNDEYLKDSVAALTMTIDSVYAPAATRTVYKKEIIPTEDGTLRIGFHDVSETYQFIIGIDSISFTHSSDYEGPDSVASLSAKPGEEGSLSATLTFNIADKLIDGQTLSTIDSTEIYRDGKLIDVLGKGRAGERTTCLDAHVPTSGFHTYSVVSYANGFKGRASLVTTYVGTDIPQAPENPTLMDNNDNIIAYWDPYETGQNGVNGGYINADSISVSLYDIKNYRLGDLVAQSEKGDEQIEISKTPDEGSQQLYSLAAIANSPKGESSVAQTNALVIGKPLPLPYKESFKSGGIDNEFAWTYGHGGNTGTSSWILDTQSQDGDGGSAIWHSYTVYEYLEYTNYDVKAGDQYDFNTPKINLNGAANPRLYFYVYTVDNDPAHLKVIAQTPNGIEHELAEYDLSKFGEGWTMKSADLSEFASERYVIVKFRSIADEDNPEIGLDNITIFDQLEHDLAAVNITTPSKIRAGKTDKVDVVVKNFGGEVENGYDVMLYDGNKVVDSVSVSKQLGIMETDTVSMNLTAPVNKETMNVKAEVRVNGDLDESDDFTETNEVVVIPSKYPNINDLAATTATDGVSLSWGKPAIPSPSEITEGFEDYERWDTEFGDWKLVDGDKGYAYTLFGRTYPNDWYMCGKQFAFTIMDPNYMYDGIYRDLVSQNPGFAAHSGNQFAGNTYIVDEEARNYLAEDNWLISPDLPGTAQTIKFYAFNVAFSGSQRNEYFDVLYSTTGNEPEDFKLVESDIADGTNTINAGPANWKEISVNLPEGAKYFAIHHNNPADNHGYVFGIDDVTFIQSAIGANDSITGFNIYLDGEKIDSVRGDIGTYTDTSISEGSHVYNITVLYQDAHGNVNESGFSNDANVIVTGIENVKADAEGRYDVYTIDGKTVMLNAKNINKLSRGIYIINGTKYIIK